MLYQLFILAAIIYLVYVIAQRVMGGSLGLGFKRRQRFKCETCRSCGKIFDDGVMCQFQGRETFKNETHIGNCIDYRPK